MNTARRTTFCIVLRYRAERLLLKERKFFVVLDQKDALMRTKDEEIESLRLETLSSMDVVTEVESFVLY